MKTIIKLIKENPDAIYGKGANEVDIVEAEEKLELKFADEYREYLSVFAIAAIDGNEFTGLSKSSRTNVVPVTQNQRRLLPSIPADWYVIEETNIDGIIIWQSTDGTIYQTSPNTSAKKIADSFEQYLLS